MSLGLSVSTYTSLHVALSLTGIVAGFAAVLGMLGARKPAGTTLLFLAATTATSVTGFCFPSTRIGIGHAVGILSLAVLVPTIVALYGFRLAGPWRAIYAAGATAALYLNVLIGVIQAFARSQDLRELAPTPFAPAIVWTQLAVLALFIALGVLAVRRFHPCAPGPVRIWLPRAPI